MSNVDEDGVQVLATLDEKGRELPDPVPVAPPVGMTRPMSLVEQIRQHVRREMSQAAHDQGLETFEEADDFDVDDDLADPHTPYEAVFDPPPPKEEARNGDRQVDQGRSGSDRSGTGSSGEVVPSEPGADQNAPDAGSGGKAADRDTGGKGKGSRVKS